MNWVFWGRKLKGRMRSLCSAFWEIFWIKNKKRERRKGEYKWRRWEGAREERWRLRPRGEVEAALVTVGKWRRLAEREIEGYILGTLLVILFFLFVF